MDIPGPELPNEPPGGTHKTDIAIIGAGPVGLFGVFQCGMLGMRCHVIDALDQAGGQCAALYPGKPIYDIPALPAASGGELVGRLCTQAAPFDPALHLGQQVTALDQDDGGRWRLRSDADTEITAGAVIIAAGVGAFAPKRPPLADIEIYEKQAEGNGVHYLVRDPAAYSGKRVVIAGGGDSAVDWALALADEAMSVHIVHRRDKFRAQPESLSRLHEKTAAGLIEMVVPGQLSGLKGSDGVLTAVAVDTGSGKAREIAADALLAFYGLAQNIGPIAHWGLDLDRNRIPVDPTTAATNLPGVFAVGDIAEYPNKRKLILTGFSEAAFAAHAAYEIIFPGKALHFEYSTTKGLPTS